MKTIYLFLTVVITASVTAQTNTFPSTGNAGIGTTSPLASAALEMKSTSKGLLIPRMTKAQRDLVLVSAAAKGLLIYQTDNTPGFYYYNGTAWTAVASKAQVWSLTGNAGTDATKNFIGTTDAHALVFRVNNVRAGFVGYSASSNTSFGYQALSANTTGNSNTGVGYQALYSNTTGNENIAIGGITLYYNTTGSKNTALGRGALYSNTEGGANTATGFRTLFSNTTGDYNTANGYNALSGNTTGFQNTANGSSALYSNTTGGDNVATGFETLYSNTTGYSNTANGDAALFHNTTGDHNTANGYNALSGNTTGYQNTANGGNALSSNSTGNFNTASGSDALKNNTTGYYNAAIGYSAFSQNQTGYGNTGIGVGTNLTGFTNLIDASAIGYNANVNANDKIVIGTASNNNLTGGYGTWQSFSDGRFKDHVQENVPGLAFITKLHPVTYNLNAEKIDEFLGIKRRMDTSRNAEEKARYLGRLKKVSLQLQTGFIAQEIEATAKSIGYDFDGVHHPESDKDNYTIGYAAFVVPLVKAVQELSKMNDDKDASMDSLKFEIRNLKLEMEELKAMVVGNRSTVVSSASLYQNIPNPFSHSTTINYTLPQKFASAQIVMMDKNGNIIKKVNVSGTGKGSIMIDATTLAAGVYSYSLIIDGKLISTKQMVFSK
jgi:hypothetical protein